MVFLQKEVTLDLNDEVVEYSYVNQQQLRATVEQDKADSITLTSSFRLITDFFSRWDSLNEQISRHISYHELHPCKYLVNQNFFT